MELVRFLVNDLALSVGQLYCYDMLFTASSHGAPYFST